MIRAVATATFSESTRRRIGTETRMSTSVSTRIPNPVPSAPDEEELRTGEVGVVQERPSTRDGRHDCDTAAAGRPDERVHGVSHCDRDSEGAPHGAAQGSPPKRVG